MRRRVGEGRAAVLVIGNESSGTKLMTRMFVEAGYLGDYDHHQRWDMRVTDTGRNIVWRRSFPHAGAIPDIVRMVQTLEELNYNVFVVVIVRAAPFAIKSQVRGDRAPDEFHAMTLQMEMFPEMFRQLEWEYFCVVTYESLVAHGRAVITWLLRDFIGDGDSEIPATYIYDANKAYTGEADG